MEHWTNRFKILVINLKHRQDRLKQVVEELGKYAIPFQLIEAIPNETGALGLLQTMRLIFQKAINEDTKELLLFEDDVLFLNDPNVFMDECLKQLPDDYDLLFLGGNPTQQFTGFYSPNLLPVSRMFSTHAVLYSRKAMERFLELGELIPLDVRIMVPIQQQGKSFCTYPLLCTQRAGHSDIENRDVDWDFAISKRYNFLVNQLKG